MLKLAGFCAGDLCMSLFQCLLIYFCLIVECEFIPRLLFLYHCLDTHSTEQSSSLWK